ncbi:MAG: uroporphyrinogen-III synthase [Duncaniella sp.]|nr:uroporphyrinogen-III synthase [Duncaniella sp.]
MKVKKILVSQPQPETGKSPYYDIAEKYGVEVVLRPFIKVEGLTAKEFRQSRINISEFTGIIFTARTAIDHFFRLCEEMRITIPDTMKYFCTSESIALYLQKYIIYRKRKIFHGTNGKFDTLLPYLIKYKKENLLWAVSDVHKEDSGLLDQNGITYTKAVMYRTVSNDFGPDEPFDYDMLVFFSPSGIESLKKNFPEFEQGDIKIACFGPSTCQAVTNAGLRLDIAAPSPEHPSMTGTLDAYLRKEAEEAAAAEEA